MNEHALRVLQFHEALNGVAGFAAGPLGAEAVRTLRPGEILAAIDTELQRVEQMQLFLQRSESWSVPAVPDLRAQLRKLQVPGSVLEPGALRDVAALLECRALEPPGTAQTARPISTAGCAGRAAGRAGKSRGGHCARHWR